MQTINPELAKEWNYDRNGNLKPEDVTANNGKRVWWICNKGTSGKQKSITEIMGVVARSVILSETRPSLNLPFYTI